MPGEVALKIAPAGIGIVKLTFVAGRFPVLETVAEYEIGVPIVTGPTIACTEAVRVVLPTINKPRFVPTYKIESSPSFNARVVILRT